MIASKKISMLIVFLMSGFVSYASIEDFERLRQKIKKNEKPSWMLKRIKADLSLFSSTGITQQHLDTLVENHKKTPDDQIVRYQIYNGLLTIKYAHKRPQDKRLDWLTRHFSALASAVKLPNVDFIVSLEDCADDFHKKYQVQCPLFAFAKDIKSKSVVLIPDAITLKNCKKLVKDSHKGSKAYPWKKKKAQLFWRGASTGNIATVKKMMDLPRFVLTELSLLNPTFIDAHFNSLCQIDDAIKQTLEKKGFKGDKVPIWKHMEYKFQLLIDGNSSAYERAYWQLFSNSVIFKQASPNIQWYYDELQPYVHFIPVANDLRDLIDQITWARNNDKQLKSIIRNANDFAEKHLHYDDMLHYMYMLLKEYSTLQKF